MFAKLNGDFLSLFNLIKIQEKLKCKRIVFRDGCSVVWVEDEKKCSQSTSAGVKVITMWVFVKTCKNTTLSFIVWTPRPMTPCLHTCFKHHTHTVVLQTLFAFSCLCSC